MSLVSSMDMTMAFGSHSVVSGEMGTLALRDYKSSKKVCKSVFHSSGLRERIKEQLIRREQYIWKSPEQDEKRKKCCKGRN